MLDGYIEGFRQVLLEALAVEGVFGRGYERVDCLDDLGFAVSGAGVEAGRYGGYEVAHEGWGFIGEAFPFGGVVAYEFVGVLAFGERGDAEGNGVAPVEDALRAAAGRGLETR